MKPYRALLLLLLVLAVAAPAADVTGSWLFVFDTEAGERSVTFALKVADGKVTGSIDEKVPVSGTFTDGELRLRFPFFSDDAGLESDLSIAGSLDGDVISGSWTFAEYSGPFRATRR